MMLKKASFICIFLMAFISCGERKEEVKTLKLAHSLSVDHPVHLAMEFFADRVKAQSEGKLEIEIYSGSQLGSERQALELLQIGSLAMTKVSSAVMENFSPKLKVFGYPYLFRDKEHRYAFYDSQLGEELLLDGEKYWLRGLTYFDAGSRSFYFKDSPVETPEDLKGKKVRVMQSPMAISLVKALGGSPTPVSWAELYTSLQQGVVDGAENNLPSFYTSKHYEICKYFSVDQHTAIPDILVISDYVYQKLSAEERQWIQQGAREASVKERELWEAAEEEALREIKKAGVQVNYPDKDSFREKSQAVINDLKETEPGLYDLAQKIKKLE
ncbi:TRAP transporter substrate-binding protein [Gramella sp. GC03-9]|uniref:TRAP transporter substrate-binding protein n=1 Tax=Christiangramia oceanisediminis TaxID=2920386 RepID=A0A9X2KXC0_9FLAO|nr:TRAP transporter substrate-binding protein [Gramella oceanisediminis]MCP9199081.1 TRAP transporter substrate-binding protein [Gramella oceanisediminis]